MTTIRAFFPQIRALFFQFLKKGRGDLPPPPPSSYVSARPTLIGLNSDEHNQGFRCYPFKVNLDRCNGSCNTLDDPSDRICE